MKHFVFIIALLFNCTVINCQYWLIKTNKEVYQFKTDKCSNKPDWNYCSYYGCPNSDSVINCFSSNTSKGEYKFSYWDFPSLVDFSGNIDSECYNKVAVLSGKPYFINNNSTLYLKKDNGVSWYYFGINNDSNYTLNETIKLVNIQFTNNDTLLEETLVLDLYNSTNFINRIILGKNNTNNGEYYLRLSDFFDQQDTGIAEERYKLFIYYEIKGNATNVGLILRSDTILYSFYIDNCLYATTFIDNDLCNSGGSLKINSVTNDLGTTFNNCSVNISKDDTKIIQQIVSIPHTFSLSENGNYTLTIYKDNHVPYTQSFSINGNINPFRIVNCDTSPSCPIPQNTGSVIINVAGGQQPYSINVYKKIYNEYNFNGNHNYVDSFYIPSNCINQVYYSLGGVTNPFTTNLVVQNKDTTYALNSTNNFSYSTPIDGMWYVKINNQNLSSLKNREIRIFYLNNYTFNSNSITVNNLLPGTYYVGVKDRNNCFTSTTFTIDALEKPQISIIDTVHPICSVSLGSIQTQVISNASSFSYYMNNNLKSSNIISKTYTFNDADAGVNTIYVKDNNNCESDKQSITFNYNPPLINSVSKINPTCLGWNDGIITVNTSNADSVLLFDNADNLLISQAASNNTFNGLGAGIYRVKAKKKACLTADSIVMLSNPPVPHFDADFVSLPITCASDNDGMITITDKKQLQRIYLYKEGGSLLDSISSDDHFFNLDAGTFILQGRTQQGCLTDYDTAIVAGKEPITALATATPLRCSYDTASGTICISQIKGGNGGYQYSINTGLSFDAFKPCADSVKVPNLREGKYYIKLQDSLGCESQVDSVIITRPHPLIFNADTGIYNGYPIPCHDEITKASVQFLPAGGTGLLTLTLLKDILTSPANRFDNLSLFQNYSFHIKDGNDCKADTSIRLTRQPDTLSISWDTSNYNGYAIRCFNGSDGKLKIIPHGGVAPYKIVVTYKGTTITNVVDSMSITLMNRPAGTYIVTITDKNHCSYTDSIILSQPPALSGMILYYNKFEDTYSDTLPYRGYAIACHGTTTTVKIQGMGGVGPYTYNWHNAEDTVNYIATSYYSTTAGQYVVKIKDTNNCVNQIFYSLNEPDTLIIKSVLQDTVNCYYSNDGSITITVEGGVSNLADCKYILYNHIGGPIDTLISNKNQAIFSNLYGSIYNVKVWDDNQCLANKYAIDIRNLDTLRVSVAQAIEPSCFGGNDGSIKLSSRIINNSNYLYPYTYTVTKINGQNWESIIQQKRDRDTLWIFNLYSGLYRIRVTDSIGCVDSMNYTLSQPAKMEILIDTIVSNRCFNDNSASLRVSASGGVGGYQFAYAYDTLNVDFPDNPNDTSSILELNGLNWNKNNTDLPLTYIVKLKDRNYKATQSVCLITDTIYLPAVKRITYDIIETLPSCFNYNDGKISVNNIKGGNGNPKNWKIFWQNEVGDTISTNQIATNLPAGTYSISILDSLGCLATNHGLELENPSLFIAVRQALDIGCDTLGTVTYHLENINSSTYLVNHNALVFSRNADEVPIFVVDTGRHVFTFKNSQGCVATDSFEVYFPGPVIDSVVVMDASIGGVKNGSAYVIDHCGNGNKLYLWTLPDGSIDTTSSPVINNLSKGNYRVNVVDRKGFMSLPYEFEVHETERISIGIDSIKPTTCPQAGNGYVSIRINAPSPIVAIDWKDDNGNILGHGYSLSGIKAGTYFVEVIDSLSNIGQFTLKVNSGKNVTITSIESSPVSCNGGHDGTIIIMAAGGSGKYYYHWSNGDTSAIVRNLTKGTYTVRITDSEDSACYAYGLASISEPAPITIHLIDFKKPTCKGGNDGELSVSAVGGNGFYAFYWPSKQVYGPSLKVISPGSYEVEVTDRKGCKSIETFTLPDTLPIEIATLSLKMPSCNGSSDGSISLSLKGGRSPYMIYWPDLGKNVTGGVRTNLQAGSYRIEARDANGCVFKDTLKLNQPEKLQIDSIQTSQPLCSFSTNGSLRIYSSGGMPPYVYRVNNQSSTSSLIANLNQGSYTVYVFDKNSCSASQEVSIIAPTPVDYTYAVKTPSCKGYSDGSITIEPLGGTAPYKVFLYNVRKPKEITNLSAGKYEIVVQDTNSCSVSKTIVVTQPEQLSAIISTTKENPCFGDCKAEMKVSGSGGSGKYRYAWSDQTIDSVKKNVCAGNYTVDVKDRNNCTFRLTHRVDQPAAIVIDSVIIVDPACFNGKDGKIMVKYKGGTGSLNYFWNHGQRGNEVNSLSAGTYYVTVKDANNCSKNDSFVVNNTPKENIKNITSYYKLCEGQVMPLWPGLWSQYLWYKDGKLLQFQDTLWVNVPGNYAVKVISFKGCEDSVNFTVEYTTQLIKANFLLSHQAVVGEDVQIIDVSWPIPEHIYWDYNTDSIELISNSDDRQIIRFKYPGEYLIKLKTTAYACVDSITKPVVVYESSEDMDKGRLPREENSDILELRLYPNPNNGTFNFYIKLLDQQNVTIEILSIAAGYSIYRNELKGADNYEIPIAISGQPAGVYTLKVITRKQIKYIQFVII